MTAAPDLLPVFDLRTPEGQQGFTQRLDRLRGTASAQSEAATTVARILADVTQRGDAAVVEAMQRWTDPDFQAARIRVSDQELDAAEKALPTPLRAALLASIENVRAYQQHILPTDQAPIHLAGAELGLRWTPVDSVGCCVPGGAAVLLSTLIMTAVPAQVAGVDPAKIAVINPPPTRRAGEPAGDISPWVLGACRLLGIERVYRIGGAQAVAALAYGTDSVQPVDLIAGPGNVFVQLAKAQVAGVTGTDGGFYGPSEIVTLADRSADPGRVASDLIAQAEHNPGKCFLVAWDRQVIADVAQQIRQQLTERQRRTTIEQALAADSCALWVTDAQAACDAANLLAAEHLNLAVADPDALLPRIRHAGEVFLGDASPVAAGDYYAGPSHCLPTGTTARFTSGLSVYTFLKRTGTVAYRQGMPAEAIDHIALLAEAEGLDAHAASVRIREKQS